MTSVLWVHAPDPDAPDLAADLATAGFEVHGPTACAHLVRDALRAGVDLVLCWDRKPGGELVAAIRTLQVQQPTPVLVFTDDASVEVMREALQAGVHAWVVRGYSRERLRPLLHLAMEREAHERELRTQLADLGNRFEERKLVDKAKGILMRTRAMSEEEAFQLLRTASMHGNLRVGQVSRQVIDAAQAGEAINRAGQQRMLSQRIAKLYALACAGTEVAAARRGITEAVARVDDNLGALASLSEATFGDLQGAMKAAWEPLRKLVVAEPKAERLPEIDALAEALLTRADALVAALENAGLAGPTVKVVNVVGRQRMLSQRIAKLALLAAAGHGGGDTAPMVQAARAFDDGLVQLGATPLSTAAIRADLQSAAETWQRLREACGQAGQAKGRRAIAEASDELLAVFERLTAAYQNSVQVLLG